MSCKCPKHMDPEGNFIVDNSSKREFVLHTCTFSILVYLK